MIWQSHKNYTKYRHHLCQTRIPAALHVCRESRIELLPHYTLLSLNDMDGEENYHLRPRPHLLSRKSPTWYVNFKVDTFVFPGYEYCLEKAFDAMGEHSQMIHTLAFSGDIYGTIREHTLAVIQNNLPYLSAIYIHVGTQARYRKVEVYNPCMRHQRPKIEGEEWDWPRYLASLKQHIAQGWGSPQAVPFKGIIAYDNFEDPRYISEESLYLGGLCSWMKM